MMNEENTGKLKMKLSDAEEAADISVPSKKLKSDELISNITQLGYNEPVQILVFPPKNKKFQFDEATDTMRLEPAENSEDESGMTRDSCMSERLAKPQSEIDKTEEKVCNSSLTPLIINCDIDCETVQQPNNDNRSDIYSCPDSDDASIESFVADYDELPKRVYKAEKTFLKSNIGTDCFLKGCKWSPDGFCLLSCSNDNVLRLFEFSDEILNNFEKGVRVRSNTIEPILHMKEGGTIYDYTWYPKMNSADPISCVLASTSQDSPIHLWDAYTGQIRATYQAINQYDEVTPAYSLCFSPDGGKLYCGFKKCLRIFDTSQPGRVSEERKLKLKGETAFQTNIISAIAVNPCFHSLYALGSYDKSIGIYLEPNGELQCLLKGHTGGITQLMFSSDGNYLFSGGRKDPEILCWDIRNPGTVLFYAQRKVGTNQRIYFDVSKDDKWLLTGATTKFMDIFYLKREGKFKFGSLDFSVRSRAHEDVVNGASIHPTRDTIFATSSGQRHFKSPEHSDGDDYDNNEEEDEEFKYDPDHKIVEIENNIKIWVYRDLLDD